MNIVMLGPFGLEPKGTMRSRALPAARALSGRGHSVTIVMPPWHTPGDENRRWSDPESGVALEYVSLSGMRLPLVGHLLIAIRMARRARSLDPDVVHAFKPKAYSGLAAALLWLHQRLGDKYSVVVDTDDWEGPGGWNDLEPYSRPQKWFFGRQETWGLRHADCITVASRALESLTWSLGVPSQRVIYVPNGVGTAAAPKARESGPGFEPHSRASGSGESDGPQILLYTRFFEFELRRPLEALRLVRDVQPGARLTVVGRGLFGEEVAFMELAADLGLDAAVDYRGWLEGGELESAIGGSAVAIWPFDDTLVNRTKSSVKLLELMSHGLPIVAEDVGQNGYVIEDRVSGRLVPSGDVGAFASAVIELLGDSDLRRRLGDGARARVRTRFSWDTLVEDLETAYGLAAQ
jgi:glycosyltransferase involved in cell wall biosynthesis